MPRASIKPLIILCLAAFIGVNAFAYMHAGAMTIYSDSVTRTRSPENLNLLSKIKVLLTGVQVPRPKNTETPEDYSLTFKTHRFSGVHGTSLEAWHIPSESTEILFLLFHGYSASKDTLLPIANSLHAMGFSTLLVDFYGSGGSDGTGTSIGYLESLDVEKSFYYAKKNWPESKLILYGQSMGAVAILRAIAEHKTDPDAVVLESIYDRMISTVRNRFSAMGVPATPLAELLVFWGGLRSGFNAFKHNPRDYAATVVFPSLVLHGQLDPRVTSEQTRAVYDQLGAWKRYSVFSNAGHLGALDSNPIQWQDSIREIVDKIRTQ